jgi:hypothetical protein
MWRDLNPFNHKNISLIAFASLHIPEMKVD